MGEWMLIMAVVVWSFRFISGPINCDTLVDLRPAMLLRRDIANVCEAFLG